jgi:hypothetical protein
MDALTQLREGLNCATQALEQKEALLSEIRRLRSVIEDYKVQLSHYQSPDTLNPGDLESYVEIQKENAVLRKRHDLMRIEKGEQKHKADMLEQRVIRLERDLATLIKE